jgi:hypothetical protein
MTYPKMWAVTRFRVHRKCYKTFIVLLEAHKKASYQIDGKLKEDPEDFVKSTPRKTEEN